MGHLARMQTLPKTCGEPDLIKANCSLESTEQKQVYMPVTKESLFSDFQYCFKGQGTFNVKPYHIVLDPKIEPVVHAPRAVPVHLHKMFKDELDQMIEPGVIVSVKETRRMGEQYHVEEDNKWRWSSEGDPFACNRTLHHLL